MTDAERFREDLLDALRRHPSKWWATGCFGYFPPAVEHARRNLAKLEAVGLVRSKKEKGHRFWQYAGEVFPPGISAGPLGGPGAGPAR